MNEQEIIRQIIEAIREGHGFGYILLAALLLKRYVINGSIKKFLDIKAKELEYLHQLQRGLIVVVREQKRLHSAVSGRDVKFEDGEGIIDMDTIAESEE